MTDTSNVAPVLRQLHRLLDAGVVDVAGIGAAELARHAAALPDGPDTVLEANHCFMTIGSRRPRGAGLDARTPAIWISGGTGRDGAARRGAPKVGWCWAGNRHTWLGFASARRRGPEP